MYDNQQTLTAASALVKSFEGCVLKAYQDQMGRWTIGYGTTQAALLGFASYKSYPPIEAGQIWTQSQAEQALQETLQSILGQVTNTLGATLRASLNSNQMAALVSFVYNLGIGSFQHSGILRGLRANNLQAAAANFLLWNRIGSYVSPGLTRRREAERALFASPPTSNLQQPEQP